MISINDYIYAQYQSSQLYGLIVNKQTLWSEHFYIPMQNFFDMVYNFATCSLEGLYIWAKMLGVPRSYECENIVPTTDLLGLVTNTKDRSNFSRGRLGGESDVVVVTITDDLLRRGVIMKGAVMFSNYSAYALDLACALAFNGRVLDNNNMTITYGVDIPLDDSLVTLFKNGHYFPRPAGVGLASVIFRDKLYNGIYEYNGVINYDN